MRLLRRHIPSLACALSLGIGYPFVAHAGNVAIYYDSAGASYDKYSYSYGGQSTQLYESLQSRLENYGHTVTVIDRAGDSSSLDLSSYDMFWDIRAVTAPDANEISEIDTLLSNGGYVFLLGENTAGVFADRNEGIISFVEDRGSGDLGSVVSSSTPTSFATGFNNNPSDLTGMSFPAAAGLSGESDLTIGTGDTGACLTSDSSDRCSAIAYERTLTGDAASGTVVQVFDVNFLQWDYYYGGTNQFMDNLINYAGAQIGVNKILAGADSVDVGSSDFEVSTADAGGTITSDITGSGDVTFSEGSDGEYSGDMSGSATLVKTGAGTLTVSGTNTHTGGNTISAGSLQATCTGISGNVANSSALDMLISSGACTYADVISGSGTLEKTGSGSLNITGTNTYTGDTTVTAGTLYVNGSISSSAVSLASGATIGGSGTVGALTANTGSYIRPGNSIGTLNVSGDFTLGSGSTLVIEFNENEMDKVSATGDVTLSGDVEFTLLGDDGYFTVTQVIVESTGGTLSGTFNSETTDNDFTTTIEYSSTAATATISKTLASNSLDGPMSSQASLAQNIALNLTETLQNARTLRIAEPAAFVDIRKFGSKSAARENQGNSGYTTHGLVNQVGGVFDIGGYTFAGTAFISDSYVDRTQYKGRDEVDSVGAGLGMLTSFSSNLTGKVDFNIGLGAGRYHFDNNRSVTINSTLETAEGDGDGQFAFLNLEGSKHLGNRNPKQSSFSFGVNGSWVRHNGWSESGLSQGNATVSSSAGVILTGTAEYKHRLEQNLLPFTSVFYIPEIGAHYRHSKLVYSKAATVTDSSTYTVRPAIHEAPLAGIRGALNFPLKHVYLTLSAEAQFANKQKSGAATLHVQIPI